MFDFNTEVKPILEVLVGKTIEQSLIEVMEEEELAALRKQQREYEELRNAEKVEQQRLEEQERRLREEKVYSFESLLLKPLKFKNRFSIFFGFIQVYVRKIKRLRF